MEAIIKDQLVSNLLSKSLISKNQHAFIKRHSTVTNLLQCTHDWAVAVHSGLAVDVVYIDFARAFDSVVHAKLVHKLQSFGVSGKLLQWLTVFVHLLIVINVQSWNIAFLSGDPLLVVYRKELY